MNPDNNKNIILLNIVDTFADQHLQVTVSISEEEFAHLKELGLKWDNPWTLDDDPLVEKLRDIASEYGNDTGINEGYWELESWEIVPGDHD